MDRKSDLLLPEKGQNKLIHSDRPTLNVFASAIVATIPNRCIARCKLRIALPFLEVECQRIYSPDC